MTHNELVGTLVGGKYLVDHQLGEGGMGAVYVAVQEPLGRRVALKVIRGSDIEQAQRERFVREAKVVAQLRCPNIVTLHDFGEHDGTPYIVMELLEGETLRARMARGPVKVEEAIAWIRDLSCALRTAHEAGIVHRDIKPENIVLVRDRDRGTIAKLLDFGIAKLRTRTDVAGVTQLGVVVGTPGYMAPELILHGRGDEPSVDIYAVGVVLHELLTGGAPYQGATPIALLMAHAHEAIPEVAGIPTEIAVLLRRLLAKDPADRPADGAALVTTLDQARAGVVTVAAAQQLSPTEVGPVSLPSRPSIAVQPFASLGGDEDESFAEGISEDILTALSCFKQLFVVAVTSMLHRDGRDSDAMRVSRLLGVRYVLQGSVRRAAGCVRINAKLVDGTTGAQVWAQRYDRALHDLFAVQDDVTRSIVACVAGRIEAVHADMARRKAPHALAAYDWLARGRALHHRRTPADNAAARAALDTAVEIDPDYAQAHAWRACAYGQAAMMGIAVDSESMRDAMQSLWRALELDDNDAECHRLACEISMWSDLDKSWSEHERALELNPNDARIVGQRGELCLYRGELEEAAVALEQAVRLDPLSPKPYQRHLASVRYMQRNLDEATRVLKRLGETRADVLALSIAVATMRGDGGELACARKLLDDSGAPLKMPRKPFANDALRAQWREGFERAGAVLG